MQQAKQKPPHDRSVPARRFSTTSWPPVSQLSGILHFWYQIDSGELLSHVGNLDALLGGSNELFYSHGNLFLRCIHPEDRYDVVNALESALRGEHEYRVTYRWTRPDTHQTIRLHCRARRLDVGDGTPPLLGGILADVTTEFGIFSRYESLLESAEAALEWLGDWACLLDYDGRVMKVRGSMPTDGCFLGDARFKSHLLTEGTIFLECIQHSEIHKVFSRAITDDLGDSESVIPHRWSCHAKSYEAHVRHLQTSDVRKGTLIWVEDVTNEEQLNRKLLTAERRLSKLHLVGRVSDEVSDFLHQVTAYAQLVMRSSSPTQSLLRELSKAIADGAPTLQLLSKLSNELGPEPQQTPLSLMVNRLAADIHGFFDSVIVSLLDVPSVRVCSSERALRTALFLVIGTLREHHDGRIDVVMSAYDAATEVVFLRFQITVETGMLAPSFNKLESELNEMLLGKEDEFSSVTVAPVGISAIEVSVGLRTSGASDETVEVDPSGAVIGDIAVISHRRESLGPLRMLLHQSGIGVACGTNDEIELILEVAAKGCAALLLDLGRDRSFAVSLAKRVRRQCPRAIVVCLMYPDPLLESALLGSGVFTVLTKPFSTTRLVRLIRQAVQLRRSALETDD